ncbi:MAG TPA: fumarylacetoacetase [Steroidobacteraceae bacterium]|nr:fumarylacetoacetase [Steroidobacteraceae bacterium]
MTVFNRPDATHDPKVRSWLPAANLAGCAFPIQNLPFGVFRRARSAEPFRGGVAIGDQILDLAAVADANLFPGDARPGIRAGSLASLNSLMQLGPPVWGALRRALFEALAQGSALEGALRACLVPQEDAIFSLPAQIGDYTDFYISIHHATAIGRQFRPDNPLLPNYKWIPIGYHGRSSSIGVSGQSFPRPRGQRPGAAGPTVGPSTRLDYELEMGIFIGAGNPLGAAIPLADAENHIFGLCLLNDWSARDLQGWEYQPLGPFLGKNFATTISPWVVTLQALAPFRVPFNRPPEDPQPLPYLDSQPNREAGAIDIRLEALIQTAKMHDRHEPPQRLSETSFRHAYWTISQLVAHHTVNGCNLRPGDLFGSGTQSGPTPAEAGSLVELSKGGSQPLQIGQDEQRTFLEDGDTVIFRGRCERPGAVTIGFGELLGRVLPPLTPNR